ncbi:hypothetical protein SRHO_G00096630 [Serrasalmus rhombeus]
MLIAVLLLVLSVSARAHGGADTADAHEGHAEKAASQKGTAVPAEHSRDPALPGDLHDLLAQTLASLTPRASPSSKMH